MGNIISEEGEEGAMDPGQRGEFLSEGFNLESPEANAKINFGTAAPNCQPKHTAAEIDRERQRRDAERAEAQRRLQELAHSEMSNSNGDGSQEVATGVSGESRPEDMVGTDGDGQPLPASSHKHRRADSSTSDNSGHGGERRGSGEHRGKRQHLEQQQQQQPKKLSYIQMAKLGYQELVNAIIRPPRADYKMESLGPPAFNFCQRRFTRTDFTLRTKRGVNLECSHWEPVERALDRIPVVIYMHGNSSARVEVIPQLSYLLSLGLAVFAFDFAGSGKSDGEYVSLGYFEREDLSCIVAHLRATNVVSTIALWGRSMGASTSLMFGDRDPSIACMILDSPFSDLSLLCEEMVEKGREQGIVVPGFVVQMALRMIQGSVKKQAGFNIRNISPISHADKCFIPALFVAGEHDDFIKKHHSEMLYEKYAGDKNIIIVEGDHNSPRPKFMFDSASIFLQTCLQIPHHWALDVPVSMNLMCPPWYFEQYEQRSSARAASRAQQSQRRQQSSRQSSKTSNGGGGSMRDSRNNSSNSAAAPAAASSTTMNGSAETKPSSSSAPARTTEPHQDHDLDNGYDHDQMGMTAERQRVIQASLFKMLGQADEDEDAAAAPARGEGDEQQQGTKKSSNVSSQRVDAGAL